MCGHIFYLMADRNSMLLCTLPAFKIIGLKTKCSVCTRKLKSQSNAWDRKKLHGWCHAKGQCGTCRQLRCAVANQTEINWNQQRSNGSYNCRIHKAILILNLTVSFGWQCWRAFFFVHYTFFFNILQVVRWQSE